MVVGVASYLFHLFKTLWVKAQGGSGFCCCRCCGAFYLFVCLFYERGRAIILFIKFKTHLLSKIINEAALKMDFFSSLNVYYPLVILFAWAMHCKVVFLLVWIIMKADILCWDQA